MHLDFGEGARRPPCAYAVTARLRQEAARRHRWPHPGRTSTSRASSVAHNRRRHPRSRQRLREPISAWPGTGAGRGPESSSSRTHWVVNRGVLDAALEDPVEVSLKDYLRRRGRGEGADRRRRLTRKSRRVRASLSPNSNWRWSNDLGKDRSARLKAKVAEVAKGGSRADRAPATGAPTSGRPMRARRRRRA